MSKKLKSANGLRAGSAAKSKGQARSQDILVVARKILIEQGYAKFTLRYIAEKVGISMGNLQYYYQTKHDLLREMLQHASQRDDEEYQRLLSKVSQDPKERFDAIVDHLLAEFKNPDARGLHLQGWALSTHDDYAEQCMEDTFAHRCEVIANLIEALNPTLSKAERDHRAIIIQSMIAGSLHSLRLKKGRLVQRPGLDKLIRQRAYLLATK